MHNNNNNNIHYVIYTALGELEPLVNIIYKYELRNYIMVYSGIL